MRHSLREALPRRALLTVLFVLLSLGAEPASNRHSDFIINGHPVHPMSVQPLVGDLADAHSIIAAVDLEGSAQNKSNAEKVTVNGAMVSVQDGDGFVAYRHIGTTPGGLHVLIVQINGCGSGIFEDALWVRIVRDQVWEDGKQRDRTMLLRVGQFTLGDRDDGEVKLDGSKLLIGKSRYRENDTIIPLE